MRKPDPRPANGFDQIGTSTVTTSSSAPGIRAGSPRPGGGPVLTAIQHVLDRIAGLCTLIAGINLVVLIAIFGWLVFGRYVLNNTPTWVEQAAILMVAYITFLSAAAGVHQGTHLSIDFVREAFPAIPRLTMRYLSDLSVLAFGVFMAWQGWLLVLTNTRRMIPMIGLTESWRAAPLAICGALMAIFAAFHILRRALGAEPVGE